MIIFIVDASTVINIVLYIYLKLLIQLLNYTFNEKYFLTSLPCNKYITPDIKKEKKWHPSVIFIPQHRVVFFLFF